MKILLNGCSAHRPDKRAISKLIEDIAGYDANLAREEMQNLLAGSPIEIEMDGLSTGSSFRALRKLNIDYEIVEE